MSNKDLIMELVNNLEVKSKNAEIIAKILDCDIDGKIADVAEVVYCKDCKHRDKDDICTELDIYAEGSVMVGDYFFCGAGERKETE